MVQQQALVESVFPKVADVEAMESLRDAKARIDALLADEGQLDGPTLIDNLKMQGCSRADGSRAIAYYVSRGDYLLGLDNVLTKSQTA